MLAAAGAKVAVAAAGVERLETLTAEITFAAGGVAAPFALDVSDAVQLIDVVGKAEAKLGPGGHPW